MHDATQDSMQEYFHALADHMQSLTHAGEITTAWLAAETSDFVRFNKSAVRQAMNIRQVALTLALIADDRRIEVRSMLTTLSTDPGTKAARLYRNLGWQEEGLLENGEVRFGLIL